MEDMQNKLKKLEEEMMSPNFWNDKAKAQAILKEVNFLKSEISGKDKYNKGHAIMTSFSGAVGA